mmetsp:Transcript_150042/g.480527  ORF Transcript_150042/g.480527 Transcript_150042/m.480527 type:complete len:233 (-) Transcript_150042:147-845(-)
MLLGRIQVAPTQARTCHAQLSEVSRALVRLQELLIDVLDPHAQLPPGQRCSHWRTTGPAFAHLRSAGAGETRPVGGDVDCGLRRPIKVADHDLGRHGVHLQGARPEERFTCGLDPPQRPPRHGLAEGAPAGIEVLDGLDHGAEHRGHEASVRGVRQAPPHVLRIRKAPTLRQQHAGAYEQERPKLGYIQIKGQSCGLQANVSRASHVQTGHQSERVRDHPGVVRGHCLGHPG